MTPEEKTEFENLKKLVHSLLRVENVEFIENIKRRGSQGLVAGGTSAATSMIVSVRDAADTGSETVTDNPDTKLKVVSPNGDVYYLPAFNS